MISEDGQRIAALMLAAGGLTVRDIARAMRVHEYQVRAWLEQSSQPPSNDERDNP